MSDLSEWGVYQKLVLKELEAHGLELGRLHEELILMRIEVARLKTKAGVWGMLAGLIPVIIAVILNALGNK